jgi:EmrB/QacA subfamily drug resistance transporter
MVALDATIMNIALPSAQAALHPSDADRQWVITAYTLAFAGLLLLSGRIADYLGRKRVFLAGLAGFVAASALGGAALNFPMLVAARALQGAFAAVLTPTALSLLAVTFTQPKERARAFAVYGAIASGGGAVGLLAGGVLTEFTSWRWCLYVNVIIGLAAGLAGLLVLAGGEVLGGQRFDVVGVVLVTGGLVSVVYACTRIATPGRSAAQVIVLLVAGVALLTLFVVWESRAAQPLLPLRLLWERNRGGACVASGLAIVGLFGMSLLLTYYFQAVLGYSPVRAGLAFLPMTLAVAAGAFGIASPLLPRVRPRLLIVPGLLVTAAGLLLLTRLTLDSGYLTTTAGRRTDQRASPERGARFSPRRKEGSRSGRA